jgi:hypothetical protein
MDDSTVVGTATAVEFFGCGAHTFLIALESRGLLNRVGWDAENRSQQAKAKYTIGELRRVRSALVEDNPFPLGPKTDPASKNHWIVERLKANVKAGRTWEAVKVEHERCQSNAEHVRREFQKMVNPDGVLNAKID